MGRTRSGQREFDEESGSATEDDRGEARASLRSIYAPVLAYVILFQQMTDKGSITADRFRQEVRGLLDRAGKRALAEGHPPKRVDHARFSIVAFVDEVVLNSDWNQRADWMDRPLQFEEYQTSIAGEQFFDRLEGGGDLDAESAEVAFVVLSLGFKGRYVGNESELVAVRRNLFKRFPADEVLSVAQLTPEAYATSISGLPGRAGSLRWTWIVGGAVAALVVIVWLLLGLGVNFAVSDYREALGSIPLR